MVPPRDERPTKSASPPDAAPTKSAFDPASLGLDTATSPASSAEARPGFAFLAPPQAAEEIGRLGVYRVLEVLGQGGMGVVFRAEDPKLKRQVALKVMLPQYAAHPLAAQRFLREARNQAAVEHDHIIPIFQADEDAAGTPFIAMPLLKGQTLAAALRQTPRPPIAEVLRIGREIAEGLAAAHGPGLMHRDIKPANVWLEGPRRRVKILDFGLARAESEPTVDAEGAPLTASGVVVGTPLYMSPEQGRGEAVDHRTDLFALGVVLYQMTTGALPFTGSSTMAILTALALKHPRPPADVAPGVPPALDALILALLEKHPADRPPTAQAVADELRRIEQGLSQTLVAIPLDRPAHDPWAEIDITDPNTLIHAPTVNREPTVTAVRRLPWWGWAAVGLAALIAVGFAVPQVIRILTPKGTLIIEATDPDVEVLIRGKDGAEIRTKSRHVELRVGDYGIELAEKKDGFRLTTDKFSITEGGRSTVQVRLDRKETRNLPLAGLNPPAGEADRKAAEWVLSVGGEVEVLVDGRTLGVQDPSQLPKGRWTLSHVNLKHRDTFAEADLDRLNALTRLTSLYLLGMPLTDTGLIRVQQLKSLQVLHLQGTKVTDAGLEHLKNLGLTRIILIDTGVTDAGLVHLAKCKSLLSVSLTGCKVTRAGVEALAVSLPRCQIHWSGGKIEPAADIARPHVAVLLQAGVRFGLFRGEQPIELTAAHDLKVDDTLNWLTIAATAERNPLADPAVGLALRSLPPAWVGSVSLTLEGPITDDQFQTVTGLPGFRSTRALLLLLSAVTDAGLAHVASLPDVLTVEIQGCPGVSDVGLNRLAALPRLNHLVVAGHPDTGARLDPHPTLYRIGLHYCPNVGDAAAARLAAFPKLREVSFLTPKLTATGLAAFRGRPLATLGLNECTGIGDEAIDQIVAIPSLIQVNLLRTKVTETGVKRLAAALPRCNIGWDGGVITPAPK